MCIDVVKAEIYKQGYSEIPAGVDTSQGRIVSRVLIA
jgi:hypothetical protein